jgi:hypothetical protein
MDKTYSQPNARCEPCFSKANLWWANAPSSRHAIARGRVRGARKQPVVNVPAGRFPACRRLGDFATQRSNRCRMPL